MFRQLAADLQAASTPVNLFDLHPIELARAMEDAWAERVVRNVAPGATGFERRLPQATVEAMGWPLGLRDELKTSTFTPAWQTAADPITWSHAMYAYLVESTNAFEIFRRVLWEYAFGERLGSPTSAARRWLRATEDLFYAPAHPHTIGLVHSEIRPDSRAVRRNLFWRLFGVDLQHQAPDGRPYPYDKPDAANREFIRVWEHLLREIWRGVENSGNTGGANPTDDNVIVNLTRSLANMLSSRRINGNLVREEFDAVCAMSWAHYTIEWDSPIVVDMRCQATSAAERLRLIGERVGVPAYARSDACLELADPLSRFMIMLEEGTFATTTGAASLYLPEIAANTPNPLRATMTTIITQWSNATGRPMKAPQTEVVPAAGAMRTVAQAPATAAATSPTNGSQAVSVG